MKRNLLFVTATILAAGCSSAPQRTAQAPSQNYRSSAQYYQPARQADFVGPQGPDGPTGATGAQGPTGQTGSPGYAAAGLRGPDGPTGAPGEQGYTGQRGPAGELAVGPQGAAGRAGNTGNQGGIGQTGIQGRSADGYAGPAGPAGRTGAQGATGDAGVQGPTLVGPSGTSGRAGPSGERGETGLTGAQGSTTAGIAGIPGNPGAQGPQGATGRTGAQGPTGVVDRWVSYRDFWFEADVTSIHDADAVKIAEIAAYMKENPSLMLGIDGSRNPRATEQYELNLRDRRVVAIRDSLISAGVSASRISDGMFGDVILRRNGRVEVFIKTNQLSQSR